MSTVLVRLTISPSVLGDGLGEAAQSIQKRLLLSGSLYRSLTTFFGSALLSLATFLSGLPAIFGGLLAFLSELFQRVFH